jgi:methionyl-tRNA formyltransferase
MNPRPGAFTFFEGQKIHIWSSIPETDVTGIKSGQDPGTYLGLDQNSLRMQCGNGSVLKVQEIQKPSKKRINGREFISGERTGMFEKLFEI